MSDEWQGWLHEFPSREAVEAHVAAYTPPPSASPWMTGAPWLRHHGDLTVIYLAVRDGEVRARLPNGAAWHTLEMGRAGMWRPITAFGEATDGCDAAFNRGVEAMRGAAMKACGRVEDEAELSSEGDVAMRCANRIRALKVAP